MLSLMKKLFIMLCKVWFSFTFYFFVVLTALTTRVVHMLVFLPKKRREQISAQIAGLFFRSIFVLNPQFEIEYVGNGEPQWDKLFPSNGQRPLVLVNHTSQLDALFYSASIPSTHIKNLRTLAASKLFNIPLFGTLLRNCGHFPVYFAQGDKMGDFRVDKEAQQKVQEQVEKHVDDGGGLSLFPEGQINREDTKKLQSFRRGSLALARQKDLNLWGFIHVGVDDAWPIHEQFGGYPAKMRFKLFQIPTKPADEDIVEYVSHIEKIMQLELDLIHAIDDHAARSEIEAKRNALLAEIHEAAHGDVQVEEKLKEAVDMETHKSQ